MGGELLLVGVHVVLGIALVTLGALALTARKSARSNHPRFGEAYFWLLVLALGTGMLVGAQRPGISVFEIATPPTLLLGILGYVMAKRRPRRWLGRSWVHWHIFGQGGSYIGVATATSFQVVPRAMEAAVPPHLLPPAWLLVVALFTIPAVVGSFLIARAQRKWHTVPAPPRRSLALAGSPATPTA